MEFSRPLQHAQAASIPLLSQDNHTFRNCRDFFCLEKAGPVEWLAVGPGHIEHTAVVCCGLG